MTANEQAAKRATKRATKFPLEESGHVAFECPPDCNRAYCPYCDDDLFSCVRCDSFESATTTHCPNVCWDIRINVAILEGQLDYRNGEWAPTRSPHVPLRWIAPRS